MCGSFWIFSDFNLNFLFVYFGHNFCRLVGTHCCCSIALVVVVVVVVVAVVVDGVVTLILFDMHYQLGFRLCLFLLQLLLFGIKCL